MINKIDESEALKMDVADLRTAWAEDRTRAWGEEHRAEAEEVAKTKTAEKMARDIARWTGGNWEVKPEHLTWDIARHCMDDGHS